MGSGIVIEAVPVAGLTENFSPRSLIAPPPLGAATVGRRSAARAGLSVRAGLSGPAEAAGVVLSGKPAGGLAGDWPIVLIGRSETERRTVPALLLGALGGSIRGTPPWSRPAPPHGT